MLNLIGVAAEAMFILSTSRHPPPPVLARLMRFNGGQGSREFMNHISNCLFNFTSLGAKIDNNINDGHGPYVFQIRTTIYTRH
jgi:hypothetical protein